MHVDGVRNDRFVFYLIVSLKPQPHQRNRFGNEVFEVKHNPCDLKIAFSELRQMVDTVMVDAVTHELGVCYRVLTENGLLENLQKAKKEGL